MGRGGCGGCCSKVGDEVDHDPSYNGPIKKRSCTDVLCLLFFILFIAGWGVVSVYSFMNGNPAQLFYPSNSQGEICGNGDYVDKPNLLFFDLTRCIQLSAALSGCATPQVCVSKCPTIYWSYVEGPFKQLEEYCTMLSPGEFENTSIEELVKSRKCPAYILPSTQILGRCVPDFGLHTETSEEMMKINNLKREDQTDVNDKSLKEGIDYLLKVIDLRGVWEKLISDLSVYWWIIFICLLLAMVLSFCWIVLLRCAAAPMIWLSLLLCIALLVGATVFSWLRYHEILQAGSKTNEDDPFLPPVVTSLSSYYHNKELWLVLSIILSVFTGVILIVLFFLRSRIRIAIELIEEASKAIGSNMATLFFPIGPFLGQVLTILWFTLVAVFLATCGGPQFKVVDLCDDMTCINTETNQPYRVNEVCEPSTFNCTTVCPQAKCVFYKFGPSSLESGLQVYNMFALFWLVFFVQAMGEMVLAGVFAGWYWTFDKKHDLPSHPILSSFYRTVRYHLGTLAFGSLILTFIRMIRVAIEYVQDKLKQYGEDNPVVKAVLCMCKCCFYCLEHCIKFLNRNAYIMTAVYGYNFCAGARRAFSLLARNLVRVVVLDKVTDFILFIGKVIVVALVILTSTALFQSNAKSLDRELNYQAIPIILILVSTYAIASCFFSVYNMAVDTIFLSFLEDIEKHDGSPEKPYFMDEDLRRILGYHDHQIENNEEPVKS